MVRLKTRVFELAGEHGFESDAELARAMDVSPALVSRVRSGRMPGGRFIRGALRAFPGKSFDDLFEVVPDDANAEEPAHA